MPDQVPRPDIFQPTNHTGRDWLSLSGKALVLFGLLHVPVYLVTAGQWEGSVSWRKPILFGVSTGMTLWSLGWLVKHLNQNVVDRWAAKTVAVALVIEVLLIAFQQWRGVASHFNQSTLLNAGVDRAMLVLITIAVVGICYFAVRSFGQLHLPDDYRWAIRLGMLFLVASCIIGFVISAHGYAQHGKGLPPETIGQRGVAKFPHGVAIHALQLFPALVYVLRLLRLSSGKRLAAVAAVATSTLLQMIFAIVQTWAGNARFELNSTLSTLLFALSMVPWLLPLYYIARQTAGKRSPT